ncbi:MAG: bifunctional DNA primase/polymerase [Planctomycetota bacterium]
MNSKQSKRGEAARWYAKHYGWSVFPCHSIDEAGRCTCGDADCHSPGKHPRVPRGFLDGTKDDVIIKAWWDRWPDANPAVATGAPSGFFVVDVDPGHGGDDSFETLKNLAPWPDTVQALTGGGGRHFLLGMPEGVSVPSKVGILPGIDIRGDGGYIIVTPAAHRSGRNYEWEASSRPGEVKIAAAHEKVLDVVLGRNGHGAKTGPAPVLPEKIKIGERNHWLASIAGSFRRRGFTEAEILAALRVVNTVERLEEPVGEQELADIAKSICRYPAGSTETSSPARSLTVLNAREFLAKTLQPREAILETEKGDAILRAKDLVLAYGWRGVSKTWLALLLACGIACGGRVLRWIARKPRRVLFVDGEMAAEDVQHRVAAILAGMEAQPDPDFFKIVTPDLQESGTPNLATFEGQALLEPHLKDVDVVFIDNLSTLANGGPENDSESWDAMQTYILKLRRRGITVFMVHHAGKGGKQRGTSKREDVVNLVLSLRHPSDYSPSEGSRFEVHFEKARGVRGDAVAPFEARLETGSDGILRCSTKDCETAWHDEAIALKKEGCGIREIAGIVGRDPSNVSRFLRQAKKDGKL